MHHPRVLQHAPALLGLDVHDAGRIESRAAQGPRAIDVLTVEPGSTSIREMRRGPVELRPGRLARRALVEGAAAEKNWTSEGEAENLRHPIPERFRESASASKTTSCAEEGTRTSVPWSDFRRRPEELRGRLLAPPNLTLPSPSRSGRVKPYRAHVPQDRQEWRVLPPPRADGTTRGRKDVGEHLGRLMAKMTVPTFTEAPSNTSRTAPDRLAARSEASQPETASPSSSGSRLRGQSHPGGELEDVPTAAIAR